MTDGTKGDLSPNESGNSRTGARERCGSCVHWDAKPGTEWQESQGLAYGICRVNPPATDSQGVTAWPQTEAKEWCGQHSGLQGRPVSRNAVEVASKFNPDNLVSWLDQVGLAAKVVGAVRCEGGWAVPGLEYPHLTDQELVDLAALQSAKEAPPSRFAAFVAVAEESDL